MQTTEIRMITDLDSAVPQSLDFNFEEVKGWLSENLTAYRTMVVTEDGLGAAKADKAKIRKISSAISEQRIAVKKRYLEPYNSFEAKMKELSGMCDEAAKNIDTQLKAFEEKRKAEKRDMLREYFHSVTPPSWLAFERIENPRWMNATFSLEDAKKEIDSKVQTVQSDLDTIRRMESDFQDELMLEYQRSLEMRSVIARETMLVQMKKQRDAQRVAQEAAAKKAAEREAAERATFTQKPEQPIATTVKQSEEPTEPLEVLDFRCYLTRSQKIELRDWLLKHGIKFGRVPKEDY